MQNSQELLEQKDQIIAANYTSEDAVEHDKRAKSFMSEARKKNDERKYQQGFFPNPGTAKTKIRREVAAVTILGCLPAAIGTAMIYAPYLFLPYVVPPLISVSLIVVGALCLSYALYLSLALCRDEEQLVVRRTNPDTTDDENTAYTFTSFAGFLGSL